MAAIAIAGLVVTVVAAAASAYVQYEQAEQQSKVAKYNAKVAENRAIEERQRAAFAAEQQREANRRVLARQRAAYGAADVEVNAGSPLLVMADSARQAELDAQIILSGGAARASGFTAQSNLDRFQAQNLKTAGYYGAGTTLLSGGARAYTGYAGAQQVAPATTPDTFISIP